MNEDFLTKFRMLYDFHRQQNAKKPGTIHATYLISGTKQIATEASNANVQQDGEDTPMQSSPFMSSSLHQPEESTAESGVLSITLVKEENLEGSTLQHVARLDNC